MRKTAGDQSRSAIRDGVPLHDAGKTPVFQWTGDDAAVCLWWLGQAGFAIAGANVRLLIDAYLSDSLAQKYRGEEFPHERMAPSPVAPDAVRGVDVALCSHAHTDHMDPGTLGPLVANNPQVRVVVPRAVRDEAEARGAPAERIVPINAGESVTVAGVTIEAVPAAHEELQQNGAGEHRFLGYLLDVAGVRIYHSGDCVPYSGQADDVRRLSADIALLPVNGRDAFRLERGVLGNFTAEEACELCAAAAIPVMIPHHWGMFEFNTVPTEGIQAVARRFEGRVRCVTPTVGGCFVIDV